MQRDARSMSSQCMLSEPGMKNKLTFLSLICGLLFFRAVALAQTRPPAPSQMDPSTTREQPLSEIEEEIKAKLLDLSPALTQRWERRIRKDQDAESEHHSVGGWGAHWRRDPSPGDR